MIHTHTPYAIDVLSLATRLTGRELVVTFRGAVDVGRRKRLERAFALNQTNRVTYTAVSLATRSDYVAKTSLQQHEILIIPNGIQISSYADVSSNQAAMLRHELGISQSDVVFGTVGRLNAEKGHEILIKAARHLSVNRANFRVVIIGDGPERKNLEVLISTLCMNQYINIIGFRTDVPMLLRMLDVFVLPSYTEGLSNALLEAMASGLPCVATNVGGNPELIGDGVGVLVPPKSVVPLADAMNLMCSSDQRASFAEHSKKAVQRFDLSTMISQYVEVYKR